jgi:Ca2+-binding EF-hand superfamily protein
MLRAGIAEGKGVLTYPDKSRYEGGFKKKADAKALFAMLDADSDGRITRTEYNDGFKVLDTNCNGFINREEFNFACRAPFATLDQDNDGLISREEWNAGFDVFDTDKDGHITAKEFTADDSVEFVAVGAHRHGTGTMTWADGAIYDGQWRDNCLHGRGILTLADGRKFSGSFRHNAPGPTQLHDFYSSTTNTLLLHFCSTTY